MLYVCGKWTSP